MMKNTSWFLLVFVAGLVCVLSSSDVFAVPVEVGSGAFSPSTVNVDFLGFPTGTIVTTQLASPATFGLTFSSVPQPGGAQGGIKVHDVYAVFSGIPRSGINFDPFDGVPAVPITLTFSSPVERVGFLLGADSGAPGVVFSLPTGTVTVIAPEFCCFGARRFVGIEDSAGISSITVTAPSTNPSHPSEHLIFDRISIDPSPTAIPEPATWLLMISGFVGLLGYGWRRRQHVA